MKLILQGVDPGVVDTGMVSLVFDFDKKTLRAYGKVWSNVSKRKGLSLSVSTEFLADMVTISHRYSDGVKLAFIEGFRNRGRDSYQDQTMTDLVQAIHRQLPDSQIVDNTGVKKVVKVAVLRLLGISRWPKTNHADLLSACRIALKGGIENAEVNTLLASMIEEHHRERSWDCQTILIDR